MISIDASLAAKWIFLEQHSDLALILLRQTLIGAELIVAPALLPIEVTNIVWRRVLGGEITLEEARERLALVIDLPISLLDYDELHEEALDIAATFNLPATYDAHYVALAKRMNCILWTADERLLKVLGGTLPLVRFVAEYPTDTSR